MNVQTKALVGVFVLAAGLSIVLAAMKDPAPSEEMTRPLAENNGAPINGAVLGGGSMDVRREAPSDVTQHQDDHRATPEQGVPAPEQAKETLALLRKYKIEAPSTLPSVQDWNRLSETVLGMHREITSASKEVMAVGRAITKERRAVGRFDTYLLDPNEPPSTGVPGYDKKWPWMKPEPDEWQSYHSSNGKIEVIRVFAGEDPRMDSAQRKEKDLTSLLREDVARMSGR